MSQPTPQTLRSLYRSLLRELPAHPLSRQTPLHTRLRTTFSSLPASSNTASPSLATAQAEQFIRYLKAQRMYVTLLERYNPGADMSEEERVRLTARRVGMEIPDHWYGNGKEN